MGFLARAAPLRFLAASVCAQLCGYAAGSMVLAAGAANLSAGVVVHAGVALGVSSLLSLPSSWRWLNALVPFGVLLASGGALPSWVLGVPLAAAVLLFLPTFWTRDPYYPTSEPMYEAVLKELPEGQAFRFLDVGSGSGKLLLFLAGRRPEAKFEGCEISPLAFIASSLRTWRQPNVRIRYRSFWKMSFAEFRYVYAFLAPPPMAELWAKVKHEMPSGGTFLVNSFEVSGVKAEKTVEIEDKRRTRLLVYRVG